MQYFRIRPKQVSWHLLFVLAAAVTADAQTKLDFSSPVPLSITSERMTVKNNENTALFDENVVIIKGDLTITADHVEVLLRNNPSQVLPSEALDSEMISQLRAWGNVKIHDQTRQAHAHEAVYNQKDETLILTGNPVLLEKDYRVTGTKITFYLKDNRSTVESSKILIYPQDPDHSSMK